MIVLENGAFSIHGSYFFLQKLRLVVTDTSGRATWTKMLIQNIFHRCHRHSSWIYILSTFWFLGYFWDDSVSNMKCVIHFEDEIFLSLSFRRDPGRGMWIFWSSFLEVICIYKLYQISEEFICHLYRSKGTVSIYKYWVS